MEPQTPENEPKLSQIRTFQGDVASAIEKQNESIVSINRAETARAETQNLSPEDVERLSGGRRALVYALLTLTLAGLGGVGAYWAYSEYREKTAQPDVETPPNQFVSATTSYVDASTLSRQATIGVVAIERSKERVPSAITQIELRRGTEPGSELLTSSDFFARLNVHAPQPLIRALNPLFMLGILGVNPPHTFLIIKIDSFENAFPGMLEWEPRLAEDLQPLFAENADIPTNTVWRDVVIGNRDARILPDANGQTALLYAFYENRLLIITDNENTFRSLVERLESAKLQR